LNCLFSAIPPLLLTQATNARERVVVVTGILILLCLVGGTAILLLRRRLFQKENDDAVAGSLFEQLRAMRDRGEISPEEFEQTRQSMIRRVKEKSATLPTAASSKKPGK
jgi:hypothetical protein